LIGSCSTAVCKLCDTPCAFVNSHVIPRSLYGKVIKTELLVYRGKTRVSRTRNGIYGQLLCNDCEKKFQNIDSWVATWLSQLKGAKILGKDQSPDQHAALLPGCLANKENIEFFAATVLWRAKNCGRDEYRELELACYETHIKNWICSSTKPAAISGKISVSVFFYRTDNKEQENLNPCFSPLQQTNLHKNKMGKFRIWHFGFPLGDMLIRLGGEPPQTGFFEVEDLDAAGKAVLWSSNIDEAYHQLLVSVSSRR
jgi:hypothetical protein